MTDIVLSITATSAVVMSFISIIYSVRFGKLQIEHNKNSVKPICSILQTNYKNFISVRIENNGTGPLIIKGVRCIYINENEGLTEESKILFELLPDEIKTKNFHRVFVIDAINYSIPTQGKLYLLSISLEDDRLRKMLIDRLKNVIISIEFTDIYSSKFEVVQQKLHLFEKDVNIHITDVEKYHSW